MGKLDSRSSRTAICETCRTEFHPLYNSKGRFCGRTCMRVGSVRIPHDEIQRLYADGLSSGEVAAELGLRPQQVYSALKARGVTLSRSEALTRWHDRARPEERAARTANANKASRGRTQPDAAIRTGAITRHERGVCVGKHEVTFAAMLDAAGIAYDQQTPLDRYNIDFTMAEHGVAVEIFTGGGANGKWAALAHRREHVLNHWHLFEVKFRKGRRVLTPGVIDQLIAFCDEVSAHPASSGHHRVVWPDGQRPRPRRSPRRDAVGGA